MLEPGEKFGKLTVLRFHHREESSKGHYRYFYECKCSCDDGTIIVTREDSLKSGHTTSCRCRQKQKAREVKKNHGMSKTRFHSIWMNMIARGRNTTSFPEAHCYALRGIAVCERWKEFENFREDMYESYQEHVKEYGEKDTTIDRVDVDGNYEPSNCKWSTLREQYNNKTDNHFVEYNGKIDTVANWSRYLGINYSTLSKRLQRGWTVQRAFETVAQKRNRR